MAYESLSDMSALAQRDMVQTVKRAKPAFARTLASTLKATRKKRAQLAGTIIPFVRNWAEGGGSYNPNAGETSFQRATKESYGAMYGGVVFRYMHMDLEDHMLLDMERGKLPDSYIDKRKRRIDTYMMEKNWAIIGTGNGAIAWTQGTATGTTLTVLATNTARGNSKGSYRFHLSTTDNPVYYSAINTTTELEVARFFVTAKLSATTVTVNFTGGLGAITDLAVANLAIVKTKTGWKKEIIGYGGHFSNASTGIYQGADRAVDPWINASRVDGSGGVTPTLIDSMKNINMTRGNDPEGRNGFVCRMATGNWNVLCGYGYTGATAKNWNVDKMSRSMKTYGLPADYEDGDTMFYVDPDYEDAYIDLHEMAPYFEYEQKSFGLKTTDGIGRQENVGTYLAGSTESYENYTESTNLVYDGRGNGEFEGNGKPNSAVFADGIPLPSIRQSVFYNG